MSHPHICALYDVGNQDGVGYLVIEYLEGETLADRLARTSQASLIGAILKDEPPPISTTEPMTSPALDHLVKTCLAKDLEERWQSAADLKRELKWIALGLQTVVLPPVVSHGRVEEATRRDREGTDRADRQPDRGARAMSGGRE